MRPGWSVGHDSRASVTCGSGLCVECCEARCKCLDAVVKQTKELQANWEDERYVRLYVRDTGDWCALSWDAQALLMHLFRKADRSGIVQLGKRGRANLPAMLGHGNETARIDSAFRACPDGCVELRGDNLLVIPNFTKAQEAKQSDRRRQEESRGKRLAEAMAQPVRGITSASHAVTPSHAVSHHVTPAVPSVPSFRAEPAELVNYPFGFPVG